MTSDSIGAASTLLASKLAVPPPHRHAIRRLRNERLLDAGLTRPLTLVAAPAGYGKTTLVTSWLSSSAARVGWVSLGPDDDDPARFWAYVTSALARLGVTLEQPDGHPHRLEPLGNALSDLADDVVLVLDDYHYIASSQIHRDLAELIELRLPRFHLMLMTRFDPPFVRARWKANGDVVEIRARDLAFDDDEMALFLDDEGVQLDASTQTSLFARVDGWPAALRLVTLWVSGQDDPNEAVARFATSDATISDYLVTEVLGRLPGRVHKFLVRTSILSELTGPLCDAVTGEPGGAQTLLEAEQQDLFVQPLDRGRTWFRYHPLFRELLDKELRETAPDLVRDLHRRASRWLADHGYAEDAIKHGVLAEEWTTVRVMILAESLAIGTRYPAETVKGWLSALPPDVLNTSPFFQMLLGYVQATTGNIPDARRALAAALEMATPAVDSSELPELAAVVHAISGGIARLECDLAGARHAAREVENELLRLGERPLPLAPMARAVGETALAGALFWHGHLDEAERLLATTETECAANDLHRMRVNALSCRALLLASAGRLSEAEVLAPTVLDLAEPLGVARSFQTTPARLALAIVAMQRGDRRAARHHLATVTEQSRRHDDRGPFLAASTLTARLLTDDGRLSAAFDMLTDAQTAWPGWTAPPALRAAFLAEEARLCLRSGDIGAARILVTDPALTQHDLPPVRLANAVTHARLVRAGGRPRAAAELFRAGVASALDERRLLTAVEMAV